MKPSSWPSRKWLAARVTALTGLVTMWITTGSWDTEESIALVTLLSSAAIAWLTPNDGPPSRDDVVAVVESARGGRVRR